jgi:hypothetical protein
MNWLLAPSRYMYKKIYNKKQIKEQECLYGIVTGDTGVKLFLSEIDALVHLALEKGPKGKIVMIDMPQKDAPKGIENEHMRKLVKEHEVGILHISRRINVATKLHDENPERMTVEKLDEIKKTCQGKIAELDEKLLASIRNKNKSIHCNCDLQENISYS